MIMQMMCHCIDNVIIELSYNDSKWLLVIYMSVNDHKELQHVWNWFWLIL
jgi:hypothetical protein